MTDITPPAIRLLEEWAEWFLSLDHQPTSGRPILLATRTFIGGYQDDKNRITQVILTKEASMYDDMLCRAINQLLDDMQRIYK